MCVLRTKVKLPRRFFFSSSASIDATFASSAPKANQPPPFPLWCVYVINLCVCALWYRCWCKVWVLFSMIASCVLFVMNAKKNINHIWAKNGNQSHQNILVAYRMFSEVMTRRWAWESTDLILIIAVRFIIILRHSHDFDWDFFPHPGGCGRCESIKS